MRGLRRVWLLLRWLNVNAGSSPAHPPAPCPAFYSCHIRATSVRWSTCAVFACWNRARVDSSDRGVHCAAWSRRSLRAAERSVCPYLPSDLARCRYNCYNHRNTPFWRTSVLLAERVGIQAVSCCGQGAPERRPGPVGAA